MDVSHWRVTESSKEEYDPLEEGDEAEGEDPAKEEDEAQEEDEEEADWQASVHFGRALIEYAIDSDALGKLARHETMLMNTFTKTLQMLLLLQDKRSNTEKLLKRRSSSTSFLKVTDICLMRMQQCRIPCNRALRF